MLSFLGLYWGLLLAYLALRPHFSVTSVIAKGSEWEWDLQQDPRSNLSGYLDDDHLNAIWDKNRASINSVASKNRCRDGSYPTLTKMLNEGELTQYLLECVDEAKLANSNSTTLKKRDTTVMCDTTCNLNCYHPADYNPDPKDCGNATALLKARNTKWDVTVGGVVVTTWKTCQYSFTNQGHNTINFCDTAWGDVGNTIAWTCGRWLDDPAKGGICSNNDWYVIAVRTPNDPGPSYSVSYSTTSVALSTPSSTGTSPGVTGSSTNSASTATLTGSSTTTVEAGNHTEVETLSGPGVTLPGGQVANNSPSQGSENSTSSGAANSGTTHKIDTAVIIGVAIGGVAVVALLAAIIFVLRRLKKHEARESSHLTPMDYEGSEASQSWGASGVGLYPREKSTLNSFGLDRRTSSNGHHEVSGTLEDSEVTGSIISHPGAPPQQPHPRSTEALIAAAAPPNMSRGQINILTANFVSLVRGRQGSEYPESEAPEPPPYRRD